jgi:hypothetical protein
MEVNKFHAVKKIIILASYELIWKHEVAGAVSI